MSGGPADPVSGLKPETAAALRLAGWHPGRRIDVSSDARALEELGYVPSPPATEFLAAFGGLRIVPSREDGPNFVNGEPLLVDAVGVGRRHQDEAAVIASVLGGSWFPIGWWLSYSHVFMGQDGAMAAYANGLIWSLGQTTREALDLMVSADRPLVCVHAPEGVKPWPRPGAGSPVDTTDAS
ncbi:SUKH-3 domain-containing protein [Streptomyces lasalocidi]|uniref:SUKH-3 domain containing protein n=1 Tax=Streptomyces lasalocidi TaxID=324833 RepID=A0A4U5WFU5_STRLS|nr:SUKH-3 domain-containing protein [Streptomyces lasalocidi]TKT00759.1 hypothetical protein E4U91_11925 [Streptomyces lasalocidi]